MASSTHQQSEKARGKHFPVIKYRAVCLGSVMVMGRDWWPKGLKIEVWAGALPIAVSVRKLPQSISSHFVAYHSWSVRRSWKLQRNQ